MIDKVNARAYRKSGREDYIKNTKIGEDASGGNRVSHIVIVI
jgi:hypothetical protein